MKLTRRNFMKLAGAVALSLGISSCTGDSDVPKIVNETSQNSVAEGPHKELENYIEKLMKEMPEDLTASKLVPAEQLEYGNIYAVVVNGTSDANCQNEIERAYNSLRKLGVAEDNVTVLSGAADMAQAKAIGARKATKANLDDALMKYRGKIGPDDVFICYFTGGHKDRVVERDGVKKTKREWRLVLGEDIVEEKDLWKYMGRITERGKHIQGKKMVFFGHPGCGHYGRSFENIPDLVAVSASDMKSPTIVANYSFNSFVLEAIARGASVKQAVRLGEEYHHKVLEKGKELGLIEHVDEKPYLAWLKLDLSKPLPKGSNGAYAKITELPDVMTHRLK